jgi:hypothetical protein
MVESMIYFIMRCVWSPPKNWNCGWVIIRSLNIPLAYFDYNNETHRITSNIGLNLIWLCSASNKRNTCDKPSKTSTSTRCSKLKAFLAYVGASSPVFNDNMSHSSIIWFVEANILIHLVHTFFKFLFLFVSINFISF